MKETQSPDHRQRKAYIRNWPMTVLLIAAEIILSVSGFGFITIGRISITVMHIPVIILTIVNGLPEGLLAAGIFGVSSLITARTGDVGVFDLLFRDPLLSVLPRLLIPVSIRVIYRWILHIADDHTLSARLISSGFAAAWGVISNTLFVVCALIILYPVQIGATQSIQDATIVVSNLIAVNILMEMIPAVGCVCLVVLALERLFPEVREKPENDPMPIRRTFQKWLLLFMSFTFFVMLVFLFQLLTAQDRDHARILLREKISDISRQISQDDLDIPEGNLSIAGGGYILLLRDQVVINAGRQDLEGATLQEIGLEEEEIRFGGLTEMTLKGISGVSLMYMVNDILLVAYLPDNEVYTGRNRQSALLLTGLMVMFLVASLNITRLVQRNVVQKIQDVNASLARIRGGNLNEQIVVTGNTEFVELSQGINATVDALKDTMSEIADKNRKEMEFARDVQLSTLPTSSQVKPAGGEYEIMGSMQPARDVGGDFFDYFLIGKSRLGIVIADVSGKGVPAALVMMTTKTLIKNYLLSGKSPAQVLRLANEQLCENNEKGMFVTVWLGILDYRNNSLVFANAAHNPPLLKKAGEPFVYMDHKTYKRSLMLGGLMETVYYDEQIPFSPGDMLFLYTDGVTEATRADMELYGDKRLKKSLEDHYRLNPSDLIKAVRKEIDDFVADAEQFDDITMVVLKMSGNCE